MTILDLITRSAKTFNGVAVGETMDGQEAQEHLATVNSMLSSWSTESLSVLGQVINVYNLVAGKQTYTIGTDPLGVLTPDFALSVRPQEITWANLINTNVSPVARLPLNVVDYEQWADIRIQTQPALTFPSTLYDDYNYPLSTIYLWGTPSAGLQLEIFGWQVLTRFGALSDNVVLPFEYEEAIIYNLAVRLAPSYGIELSPIIAALALSSKGVIQRYNAVTPIMSCDPAVSGESQGVFNIYSGQ